MAEAQASPYKGFWVKALGVVILVVTLSALGYEALTSDLSAPPVTSGS